MHPSSFHGYLYAHGTHGFMQLYTEGRIGESVVRNKGNTGYWGQCGNLMQWKLLEPTCMSLVKTLVMETMEPELVILCNQARLPVVGLVH